MNVVLRLHGVNFVDFLRLHWELNILRKIHSSILLFWQFGCRSPRSKWDRIVGWSYRSAFAGCGREVRSWSCRLSKECFRKTFVHEDGDFETLRLGYLDTTGPWGRFICMAQFNRIQSEVLKSIQRMVPTEPGTMITKMYVVCD